MVLAAATGTEKVAQRLAHILGKLPHEAPALHPFEPAAPPRRVVAVDGSHVTLAEAGDHLLGAYRAGAIQLDHGQQGPGHAPPPEVVLLGRADATHQVRERLAAAGFRDLILTTLPPGVALETLRQIAEFQAALDALPRLREGDLLLLDGALQARAALPLLDRVLEEAKARGVDVVGVCKSTSLLVGAMPALVACQMAGRASPTPTWYARLAAPPQVRGEVVAARLSPGEERVFRFDIASPSGDTPRILGSLAALAGHPAYPGYPSPLAMAHNAALLNEETKQRLKLQVMEAALRAGAPEAAWTAAFFDYHDILELGA